MDRAPEALHRAITARLLVETAAIFLGLAALTLALADRGAPTWAIAAPILAQGCWFHRLYLVGHEAVHRKLFPDDPRTNDFVGQVVLLPLLVPMAVYRAIHRFHHGHNRRDARTSALDTFVVPADAGPLRRALAWALWYLAVFAGGFFVHSLVSVALFLFLPLSIARRVSPAFEGWTAALQRSAQLAFAAGLALHGAIFAGLGAEVWGLLLGLPFVAFALVYSLFVYIYHYDTSYGSPVRHNVRALRHNRVISWWLLHFNEHATHHADASIPWHRLASSRVTLPPEYADNQRVTTFAGAILQQLRGPRIVVDEERR
ncbi:MAG: fatty acid desaturase [Nannocystaceae bacterium]